MTSTCAECVISANSYLVHLFAVKIVISGCEECVNITITMHRKVNKTKNVKVEQ